MSGARARGAGGCAPGMGAWDGAGAGSAPGESSPPAPGAHGGATDGDSSRGLKGGERCAGSGFGVQKPGEAEPLAGRGAERAEGDREPGALQAEPGRPCQVQT